MPPAARLSDMHVCPMQTPAVVPIPHVGGPIILGSFTVFTGCLPQARVGDMLVCVGPPDVIAKGSAGVFVNSLPAARMGDTTAHGGSIVVGLPTVIIGEVGSPGGGGGGGSSKQAQKPNLRDATQVKEGKGTDGDKVTHDTNNPAGTEQVPQQPADVASTNEAQMAGSLQTAAASGAPFCELCFGNGGSGDDHSGHSH